jgi:HepT-like protein
VSDKLIKRIALEQEQLNRLIDTHRSLLAQCALQPPNDIELSALDFFLHSFYSGLENIFKRIAIEMDRGCRREKPGIVNSWTAWRQPTRTAPPSFLRSSTIPLSEYLAFRHVVRQSYSFHLQWEKMAALVLNCEATMRRVEDELRVFFEGH